MPTEDFGAYTQGLTAGTQVSSTYEGRHITLVANEIVSPTGTVVKGDPVVFGTVGLQGVGVAFTSEVAATDLIAIDTEGIFNLSVTATDDAAGAGGVVVGGDLLYINTTTAVISKISNQATSIPVGLALGGIAQDATAVIAVKVHYDPSIDNAKRTYITVADGAYVYGKHHTSIFAGGESTGLEYFDQQVTGQQTGPLYGISTWMELAAGYISTGDPTVAAEVGLYDAGATLTLARVIGQQYQIQVASQPAHFYLYRVNGTNGFPIDSMYAIGNNDSLGYAADAGVGSTKSADIPFVTDMAGNVQYIRLYDARG